MVVDTVLPDPVAGAVYLATPYENPFNTLLAGYIVLYDPDRGILVKLPGRIDVEEATGQITGTFDRQPAAALLGVRAALQGRRPAPR